MYDPYKRDVPGLSDPANDLVPLTPDDDTDLPVGIKALRIWNPTATSANITVITMLGREVTFAVPAMALWTEGLRLKRLKDTGTTAGLFFHGYTDHKVVT